MYNGYVLDSKTGEILFQAQYKPYHIVCEDIASYVDPYHLSGDEFQYLLETGMLEKEGRVYQAFLVQSSSSVI
mgnify:CR=1 FL=1